MTKPTRFKQGIVTVTEGRTPTNREAFWELRYTDPDTGKEVRRRVKGLERDEVETMADHLTRQAYQGKGYLTGQKKAPSIEDGIVQAIRLSAARPYVKEGILQRAKLFLAFITEQFPTAKTWGDVRPGMIETYIRHCDDAGLAYDTIRLRVAPIKLAWRRMHEDWPELVKPVPCLRLTPRHRREIDCLNAGEVVLLLDWLRIHVPSLWPIACLQGLAGLRMLEAAALRVQDVDLKVGSVTVTDTGYHKPKTRDSWRTVPVCTEVLRALQWAVQEQRVRPATGELFVNADGNLWTRGSLTQHWRRALNQVAAEPKTIKRKNGWPLPINQNGLGLTRLKDVPPRKLRAAFATMASRIGAQDRLLKAYLGHSAGDMLGDHYRRIGLDELRSVSGLMNGWRRFAEGEESRKDSGNILPSMIAND